MNKKLFVALLLTVGIAHAEEWLEATNKDGGKILLFTSRCSEQYPNLRLMMTSTRQGQTFYGCWAYFSEQVHVTYQDGTSYMYDPAIFSHKTDGKGRQ